MKGVTFGLDDIYDDNAEGTYSSGSTYGQGSNSGNQNSSKKYGKKKTEDDGVKKVAVQLPIETPKRKPINLLGGWVDQGAQRIVWDEED